MKNGLRIFIIVIVSLVGLIAILRSTGILQWYHIPVISSEPNIKKGAWIYASNLKRPDRFDFICFRQEKGEHWEAGIWLMRVCGIQGDKIQIKAGKLFVNDVYSDSLFDTNKEYCISIADFHKIEDHLPEDEIDGPAAFGDDSMIVNTSTEIYTSHDLHGRELIETDKNEVIQKLYGKPWSLDDFGPVTVPANSFFVLGDNRHRAADSRFTGFIPLKKWKGTVLFR